MTRVLISEKLESTAKRIVEEIPKIQKVASEIEDYSADQGLKYFLIGFLGAMLVNADNYFEEK